MGLADLNVGEGSTAIDVAAADQAVTGRAIWVGTGGDVAVVHPDGSAGIFYSVPSGTMLQVAHTQITKAGTSILLSRSVK